MKIRFRFARGPAWTSRLIEWFGGGLYSHVDVFLANGMLIGARSDFIPKGTPAGVQIRPPDYLKGQASKILSLEVSSAEAGSFYSFLLLQKGKPYDRIAILGFATGRDWRSKDSWFCSELVAAALEEAGIAPHLAFTPNKISPNGLALILSALGAQVD